MESPIAVSPRPPGRARRPSGTGRAWAKLAAVRRRLAVHTLLEGILWVGAAVAVPVVVMAALDYWLEVPRAGRWLGLCVIGLAAMGVAWKRLLIPWRLLPRADDLALFVERRRPELRSRLISAVQLQREAGDDPEAAAFVERLWDRVEADAEQLKVPDLVPASRLKDSFSRAGALILVALGLGLVTWPVSGVLLRRLGLAEIPVPRKTRLIETSGNATIGRGDDLLLFARAEGVLPENGSVVLRHPSGREQKLPLPAAGATAGRYERILANVPSGFRYRFVVNDAESAEFAVEVLARPVVTNLLLTQVLPPYTGLPERPVAPGELSLLRGSRLVVRGAASEPLKQVVARLGGVETTVEGKLEAENPVRFELGVEISDPRLTSLSLDLEDRRGIRSSDSAVYPVEVVPDRAPVVRVLQPTRKEELATARGTVVIGFEASDDLGLAGLRLRHQPAGATNGQPATIDLEVGSERVRSTRRRYEWALGGAKPPLAEGALVEFWVEAVDANTVDGPGVGRSDRYLLRVVTEAEKRADLLTRAADAIGRLGDVAQGQERLNESLGRIILEKPPTRPAP